MTVVVPDAVGVSGSLDGCPPADSAFFALQLVFLGRFELTDASAEDVRLAALLGSSRGVADIWIPRAQSKRSRDFLPAFIVANYG